jgi:hypothetical protein
MNLLVRKCLPIFLALALPAGAQWINLKTKGIPRLANGKLDPNAPTPKTADGKPDLSGLWAPVTTYLKKVSANGTELPFQPWAKKYFDDHVDGTLAYEEPDANCLPQGLPKIDTWPFPYRIIQGPDITAILYEAFTQYRQIFTDGRELSKNPDPTWFGYSVGKWVEDTLVVETRGFNGKSWIDQTGTPTTDQMRVIESFRRKDFGHLEIDVTVDDPKAYTRPWNVTYQANFLPDSELMEYVCLENEKDIVHMKPKVFEAAH